MINRSDLYLGITEQASKPTDVRIREFSEGAKDPQLEALYFQKYGKRTVKLEGERGEIYLLDGALEML